MRTKLLLIGLLALPLSIVSANADWWYGVQGNDGGGIIPWSPAIQDTYREIAARHCASWNKVARITSVQKVYGDFIGFRCFFPAGYDPRKGNYGFDTVRIRY